MFQNTKERIQFFQEFMRNDGVSASVIPANRSSMILQAHPHAQISEPSPLHIQRNVSFNSISMNFSKFPGWVNKANFYTGPKGHRVQNTPSFQKPMEMLSLSMALEKKLGI